MAPTEPIQYVGRFAPSPTGPLHFGSLLAAVASYLQAKSRSGLWLLRIEDIDPPRQQDGAIEAILSALEQYGFEWDGPVTYQSNNLERHLAALAELRKADLAYPCSCSRRDLATARRGPLGTIYPGTCRSGCQSAEFAIRVRTDNAAIEFDDGLQGTYGQRLESQTGDFVILRRDGLIAYHLAVVVDDHDQEITEIVRGIDLLDSTPRQIHLQRLLRYTTPDYLHIPIAENEQGQKLSKLTGAPAISLADINRTLWSALHALGQRPPGELIEYPLDEIWSWSIKNWQTGVMLGQTTIPAKKVALASGQNGLS
jgi:glutamyl-Q tRNA(Asp) synthetase